MRNFVRGAAICATLARLAVPALANQPGFAGISPPTYVMTVTMQTEWAELVKEYTQGAIDWQLYPGGSIVPALGVPDAVASGVVQGGHAPAGYFPSLFPISNVIGDMGALNPDPLVLASAYADFAANEPAMIAEFKAAKVVYGVSTLATPSYNYICKGDLSTLADLKGKRVRTNGGVWSRFSEAIGMVSVNLPSSEIYQAMERGAVDCVAGDPSLIVSFKLDELANSIVRLELSPTFALPLHIYNISYWQSLTDDQRRAHLDASARSMARGYISFVEQVQAGLDLSEKSGIKVNQPSADLTAAYDQWVKDGFGGLEQMGVKDLRVANSREMMDRFVPYIDKWTKLFDGVDRTSEDALTEVIKTNLQDKIDVSTYGM